MTAYLIGEVVITDDSWVSSYAINVHDIVHKHGGKYLSRSGNIKQVEGKPTDASLIALVVFVFKRIMQPKWLKMLSTD